MVLDPSLQGGQTIFHWVAVKQRQDASRLVFSIPTALLQAIEVLQPDLSPARVFFTQQTKLLLVIFGWKMSRVGLFLVSAAQQRVGGHQIQGGVMNVQLIFKDSDRQHLTDQPPRNAVTIIGIVDEAFAIGDSVDDLCRIEAKPGQFQQVWLLLLMKL